MKRTIWLSMLLVVPVALVDKASADVLDYPMYPRAQVVERTADDTAQEYDFVLSPVEKIRRELKIENLVRTTAKRRTITYLLPSGTALDAAVAHYEGLLPGTDVRFRCEGRDCGRSNQWANQIFGVSVLYGPDARQFYLAGEADGELVSVYVVQRGNRRVYAHIVALAPETDVEVQANARLVQALTSVGYAVVRGVVPTRDGELSEGDRSTLTEIGRSLVNLRDTVFVVCHLYAPGDVQQLVESAGACAESAVGALGADTRASFTPFAAGPLLPRDQESRSRIELVVPHRQERD